MDIFEREKWRIYYTQKHNELSAEVSSLASAIESVADLAFGSNGIETRNRMRERMGDITKYAAQLLTKSKELNSLSFPIILSVVEDHCKQHIAFAAQTSKFLETGTDAALLEFRQYIKGNKPEMLKLPTEVKPRKRGNKNDTDYDEAVLFAVNTNRTYRDAMKSLKDMFPERAGDPYNELKFRAFKQHAKRLLKDKADVPILGDTE